jgi:hypothetical protein
LAPYFFLGSVARQAIGEARAAATSVSGSMCLKMAAVINDLHPGERRRSVLAKARSAKPAGQVRTIAKLTMCRKLA